MNYVYDELYKFINSYNPSTYNLKCFRKTSKNIIETRLIKYVIMINIKIEVQEFNIKRNI